MKLTEKAWACLEYELSDVTEQPLDPALIEAVKFRVEADYEYSKDMNEFYSEVKDIRGVDTMDRDILYDFVAKELGFEYWPLYGDTQEYSDNFYEALKQGKKYV